MLFDTHIDANALVHNLEVGLTMRCAAAALRLHCLPRRLQCTVNALSLYSQSTLGQPMVKPKTRTGQ